MAGNRFHAHSAIAYLGTAPSPQYRWHGCIAPVWMAKLWIIVHGFAIRTGA